ncbi:hypothetical protein GCM10023063_22200 [Arthrobacter methylotrophus]
MFRAASVCHRLSKQKNTSVLRASYFGFSHSVDHEDSGRVVAFMDVILTPEDPNGSKPMCQFEALPIFYVEVVPEIAE